jgi:hypothetical protein
MVKPKINSIEVHPQLSNNGHPVDGALVGAGSVWPIASLCLDELFQIELCRHKGFSFTAGILDPDECFF